QKHQQCGHGGIDRFFHGIIPRRQAPPGTQIYVVALSLDRALIIVIPQHHIPWDLQRGPMVDGFIAFLPMGVVKTGHAVIKIISGGDDKAALELLCNASHPVSHSKLTGASVVSPITEDQEIQHDKRVSLVATPTSRHLSNDNFINDGLSPGESSEAQVCPRFDRWFLTGGADSSAQRKAGH